MGLIMPSIGDYFAIRLFRGTTNVFNEHDFKLTIILMYNSQELEQDALKKIIRIGASELLIFPGRSSSESKNKIRLTRVIV